MAKKSRKKVKKVKSKSKASSVSVKSSVYVDNKLNRRLGRVGKKYIKGKSNKYSSSKGVSVKSKVGKSKKAKKGASKTKKPRSTEVGRLDELYINFWKGTITLVCKIDGKTAKCGGFHENCEHEMIMLEEEKKKMEGWGYTCKTRKTTFEDYENHQKAGGVN